MKQAWWEREETAVHIYFYTQKQVSQLILELSFWSDSTDMD